VIVTSLPFAVTCPRFDGDERTFQAYPTQYEPEMVAELLARGWLDRRRDFGLARCPDRRARQQAAALSRVVNRPAYCRRVPGTPGSTVKA
jgi:ferredoxin-thioredoxin reductase catalytic subunit